MSTPVSIPQPRRIAAGTYHNLVVSNVEPEEYGAGGEGAEELRQAQFANARGFGSRARNHVLPDLAVTGASRRHSSESEETQDNDNQDYPLLKFFRNRAILEVGCGGAHSVVVVQQARQDGAEVYTMGLGTCGRLGVRRPTSRSEAEDLLSSSGYSTERIRELVSTKELYDAGVNPKWWAPGPLKVIFPRTEVVLRVACGMDHSLALTERGMVFAWGIGSFGNLGTGETDDCWVPTEIPFFNTKKAVMVAAGTKHSLALDNTGAMYSWGHGGHGRLGQGEHCSASLVPGEVPNKGGQRMKYIAAGEANSASIDSLGDIYSWGAGSYGRLGHGEESDVPIPTRLMSMSGLGSRQVELGTLHSLALTIKGEIYGWGSGDATGLMEAGGAEIHRTPKKLHQCAEEEGGGQIFMPLNKCYFVQIAAGCFHSLALDREGSVFVWGSKIEGRLGLGMWEGTTKVPVRMKVRGWCDQSVFMKDRLQITDKHQLEQDLEKAKLMVSSVQCGGMHSAAVVGPVEDGSLWIWGSNQYGQTGFGDTLDHWLPGFLEIKSMSTPMKVHSVALGFEHCLLVTHPCPERLLYAWGRNHCGQLGLGSHDEGPITEPTRVYSIQQPAKVAAGEDHSAALLDTSEVYTWGQAECGKLGYGSVMMAGIQNYPRRMLTEEQMLDIACGQQHTAVLNTRKQLFTFGAGWYGRLGHGDMDNQYSAKLVEALAQTDEVVDQVHLGAYHTCIVTAERRLLTCGRDWAVCGDDHVSVPYPVLERFKGQLRVACLAVGEQHTLCLCTDGSLYGWGDNNKGQLGLPEDVALTLPPKVVVPTAVPWDHKPIIALAAGRAHSMALVKDNDLVYAWGLRSGGRLGNDKRAGAPRAGSLGDDGKIQRTPEKVEQLWRGVVRGRAAQAEDEPDANGGGGQPQPGAHHHHAGGAAGVGSAAPGGAAGAPGDAAVGADGAVVAATDQKKVRLDIFSVLQKRLQNEAQEQLEHALRDKEKGLKEQYNDYMMNIWGLWDASSADQQALAGGAGEEVAPNEFNLRQLQDQLEKSLCQNLKKMGLDETYPSLDSFTVHAEVAGKLGFYEDLVWVIQQHPCYLARLAQKLSLKEPTVLEEGIFVPPGMFLNVVKSIFRMLRDDRTRHLFMSLIRALIGKEIEAKKNDPAEPIFDPEVSKVIPLMHVLVEHTYFKNLHETFFDVSDPDSLLSVILEWTVAKQTSVEREGAASGKGGGGGGGDDADDAIFAFNERELWSFYNRIGAEGFSGGAPKEEELSLMKEKVSRQYTLFAGFLGMAGGVSGGRPTLDTFFFFQKGRANTTTGLLSLPPDVKSILASFRDQYNRLFRTEETMMREIEEQEAKPHPDEVRARERDLVEPMAKLFILGIVADLCLKYDKLMGSNQKRALADRVKQRVWEKIDEEKGDLKQDEKRASQQTTLALQRLEYNIKQLGTFILRAANNAFENSEQQLKVFGEHMKTSIMKFISSVIKGDETSGDKRGAEDKTEVELTKDLYMSHYDMMQLSIAMETKDLLQLSNAFWRFRDVAVELDEEMWPQDKLFQLLNHIQPVPKEEAANKSRLWQPYFLALTEKTSVLHNFKMTHRFLEHAHDLCFCRVCQAPILRSMAPKAQRDNMELRLIKTYRPKPGPTFDGRYPFLELAKLLVQKDLPQLHSRDFISLKSELEEFQKMSADKINRSKKKSSSQREYELIAQMELCKQAADLLRTNSIRPTEFAKFILDGLDEREAQKRYLNAVENQLEHIQKEREKYKETIKKMMKSLQHVVQASRDVTLPIVFKEKAAEHGVTLKFHQLERMNKRALGRANPAADIKLLPCATLSLGALRAKKVVAWLKGDQDLKKQFSRISFTFNGQPNGDWEVLVLHTERNRQHSLFSFVVTRPDIERMQRAGKTAKVPYNDGWVVMNAFNLLQLLARITADSSA